MSLILRTFFENDDSQKQARDIISQAAHDIRSPLTTLNFSVHALKSQGIGDEAIDLLNQAVSRINNIADDILQQRKDDMNHLRGVEMRSFAMNLSREMQGAQHSDKARVIVHRSLIQNHVSGDEWQLKRILYNLIQNSQEAGAKNILVDFIDRGDRVSVVVKDDGRGVPSHIQGQLGVEGFTTKANGNGLGLFSAIQKMKSWGGDLKITSTPEGTEVILVLMTLQ